MHTVLAGCDVGADQCDEKKAPLVLGAQLTARLVGIGQEDQGRHRGSGCSTAARRCLAKSTVEQATLLS